jgi:hypothetical protein
MNCDFLVLHFRSIYYRLEIIICRYSSSSSSVLATFRTNIWASRNQHRLAQRTQFHDVSYLARNHKRLGTFLAFPHLIILKSRPERTDKFPGKTHTGSPSKTQYIIRNDHKQGVRC